MWNIWKANRLSSPKSMRSINQDHYDMNEVLLIPKYTFSMAMATTLATASTTATTTTPFLLYKNTFYKNIQAEIPENIRTSMRTCPASILGEKIFFFIFG